MKINPILTNVSGDTFLYDYLTACGVKDVGAYLHPTSNLFDNPWSYPNMDKAVDRLEMAIQNKEDIALLVD